MFEMFRFLIPILSKIRNIFTDPNSSQRKIEILRKKGVHIGKNVHIFNSFIDDSDTRLIYIGDNVTISNSTILIHDASTSKKLGAAKIAEVRIGDNCFIGYGSIICCGSIIGDNCIIGAGTVVHGKIVPPNSVVVGNPAVIIGNTSEYINRNDRYLNEYIQSYLNSDRDRLKEYGHNVLYNASRNYDNKEYSCLRGYRTIK